MVRETWGGGTCMGLGLSHKPPTEEAVDRRIRRQIHMAKRKRRSVASNFVETPQGIFTVDGMWFATTREAVERYAGEVLKHEPLERLLERASVWLRSPETLAVWLLPIFMLMIDPLPAALAAATTYVAWKTLGPSAISRWLERVLEIIELVWLQGAYYVGILSYFAALEQYAAVWTGLAGFIVIRWGLLSRITSPLVKLLQRSLYELPVPDQILRGFIIRTAMAHRLSLPQLDRIEKQIADTLISKNGR